MPGPAPHRSDRTVEEEVERSAAALRIWKQTLPVARTVGEVYLRRRGITLEPPPALRFHPGLKHPSGGYWPGLVALVTDGVTGRPRAIHRTFVACDGRGKAPVDPNRLMLGPCGGGVVRLAEAGTEILVGEGLETCLAAIQATGKPAWSALSTSGLRRLALPESVGSVVVLADGDPPGAAAARNASARWRREGRQVRIAWPPPGRDFADLLFRDGEAA